MNKHHQDKLVVKELPPKMMKLAPAKTQTQTQTQDIQSAYDRVKTDRRYALNPNFLFSIFMPFLLNTLYNKCLLCKA